MQYEYLCISPKATGIPMGEAPKDTPFYKIVEAGLNDLGKQGWEMCGLLQDFIVFKRLLIVRDASKDSEL